MDKQPKMQAKSQQDAGQAARRPQSEGTTYRATYQDVLDAPPHKVAEVVDGRLYTHSRPAAPHTVAGASLGMEIGSPFHKGRGGPGGWWILGEPELHFGTPPIEDILVPDLAGWRRERMPASPEGAYFALAPDWVCEILSPSTRHLDLGCKRSIYAREGIPYLWLLDPDPRTLEAFVLQEGAWKQIAALANDNPVSLPPFDAITFPLNSLWA